MVLKRVICKASICIAIAVATGACSGAPQITRTQEVAAGADLPYRNILVVTLASSFDSRRLFEDELVAELKEAGASAVPSTSRMDTRTPVTRETFVKMVEDVDADALLLTQLVSLQSEGSVVDMNPESTVIVRPTMYWNVYGVEETEYVEPQAVEFEHLLVLRTDLYSVRTQQPVWGIESRSKYALGFDRMKDYTVLRKETQAITRYLARDGLIGGQ